MSRSLASARISIWSEMIAKKRLEIDAQRKRDEIDLEIANLKRQRDLVNLKEKLAKAELEAVTTRWAGLGYYARARNLHRTAQIITDEYQGQFPKQAEALIALPGIGKSTAHAILSIAFQQPTAILDGNVKRVLCRYFAIKRSFRF